MENTIRPHCGEEPIVEVEEEQIQTEIDVRKKSRKGGDKFAGATTDDFFAYNAGPGREYPNEPRR